MADRDRDHRLSAAISSATSRSTAAQWDRPLYSSSRTVRPWSWSRTTPQKRHLGPGCSIPHRLRMRGNVQRLIGDRRQPHLGRPNLHTPLLAGDRRRRLIQHVMRPAGQYRNAIAHAARRTGQRHHQRGPDHAGHAARKHRGRHPIHADRPQSLRDSRDLPVQQGNTASGVTSVGVSPVPPVVSTSRAPPATAACTAVRIAATSSGTTVRLCNPKPQSCTAAASNSPESSARSPAADRFEQVITAAGSFRGPTRRAGRRPCAPAGSRPAPPPVDGFHHVVQGQTGRRRRSAPPSRPRSGRRFAPSR